MNQRAASGSQLRAGVPGARARSCRAAMARLAQLHLLSRWCVFACAAEPFTLLFCHFAAATPNPRAAIALGAESLEVTQQLDDSSATTSADVVVVDATVSFVGQQDYVAAAAQLDALLKVQHAVCVSCL
jgi:hypothetical protein